LTVKAIREDEEDVALQAVEFWSTLCDYELELLEEEGEDTEEVRAHTGVRVCVCVCECVREGACMYLFRTGVVYMRAHVRVLV
jgi:hypothetical protein